MFRWPRQATFRYTILFQVSRHNYDIRTIFLKSVGDIETGRVPVNESAQIFRNNAVEKKERISPVMYYLELRSLSQPFELEKYTERISIPKFIRGRSLGRCPSTVHACTRFIFYMHIAVNLTRIYCRSIHVCSVMPE